MIVHLCETCDLTLDRRELTEHETLGHKVETIDLHRRQRGKGKVETQWSSTWKVK